jgi:hypothetical protein
MRGAHDIERVYRERELAKRNELTEATQDVAFAESALLDAERELAACRERLKIVQKKVKKT